MARQVATPINIGEKIRRGTAADLANQRYSTQSLSEAANKIVGSMKHRRSPYLDIDYKLDDKGMPQFHIYPRVPDHNVFYPNNQVFAKAVEEAFTKMIGRGAIIEAEFHELDGSKTEFKESQGPDGKTRGEPYQKPCDTRVTAYLRRENGELTKFVHPTPVPMVWIRIVDLPGVMMPRAELMEILVETIVETTERFQRRS